MTSRTALSATKQECVEFVRILTEQEAFGASNAVNAKTLVGVMKIANHGEFRKGAGRKLRALAHWAPFYGLPVLANVKGYFLAQSAADVRIAVARLRSYVATHNERIAAIEQLAL